MTGRFGPRVLCVLIGSVPLTSACGKSATAPAGVQQTQTQTPPPPGVMGSPLATPVPRPSADSLSGAYTLTMNTVSDCAETPAGAKQRTYSAAIDATGTDTYEITLGDAVFLLGSTCNGVSGIGCHQFRAARVGGEFQVSLGSGGDDHGGKIVEQIPPGTWAYYTGSGTGPIQEPIRVTLTGGGVWYCPTTQAAPFPCAAFTHCSSNLQLTFTRR